MKTQSSRNASLALSLAAIVTGMVMLAYASVPLYRLFCQVTGFAGTTQVGKEATSLAVKPIAQTITVGFSAAVSPDLPWDFAPEENQVTMRVGERRLEVFDAKNRSSKAITGSAVYNVTPHEAGGYFIKVQCFCFDKQTIGPGETAHFPVSFYIDPAIAHDPDMKDVTNITLSYTFYPSKS